MSGSRLRSSCLLGVMVALAPLNIALGEAPASTPAKGPAAEDKVPIEVFTAPSWKRPPDIRYPEYELRNSGEGWVRLNFMVSPTGKPFEITVVDSTGNQVFEEEAVKATRKATFTPASLNGKPIESGYEYSVKFTMTGSVRARQEFLDAYKAVVLVTATGDQEKSAAAIETLKALGIRNLYEDALYGLATYRYALAWGTDDQQLASLSRALSGGTEGHYLPPELYRVALRANFQAHIHARRFSEAIETWHDMKKAHVDSDLMEQLQPVVDQIEVLRSSAGSYDIDAVMVASHWNLHLFKKTFHVTVKQGVITEVKLRCDKKYVYFVFDPALEYHVADKYGSCTLELDGKPGTQFTLAQS